jgi:hypothetical protein
VDDALVVGGEVAQRSQLPSAGRPVTNRNFR